jgi:hypothetical protein
MHMRSVFFVALVCVFASPALGGSKFQTNIIATPPDCFVIAGGCLNVNLGCGIDNSECALGTMSNKSKVKIKGTLELKAKIKGVTDGTGALMTTGPAEGAADNLVLKIALSTCPVDTATPPFCDDPSTVYLKVPLTEGKAGLIVDLAPVFSLAAGTTINVLGVALLDAPGAFVCLGTNSTVDIMARLNDATCENGIIRGVGGLLTE